METLDDMTIVADIFTLPDGLKVFALVVYWAGDLEEGKRQLVPLRESKSPMENIVAPVPMHSFRKALMQPFRMARAVIIRRVTFLH